MAFRRRLAPIDVDDRTPIEQRWGGWYVTGGHGAQTHLGNLPLRGHAGARTWPAAQADRQSLTDYFDTSNYFADTSDIVALMVMEHQKFVQNEITRLSFKIRNALPQSGAQRSPPTRWADLGARQQLALKKMVSSLVRALLMLDAAPLRDRVVPSSGFARRFSQLGPRDSKGRSLRELDLETRLFRYPLSYLVYSEAFNALPALALDIVRDEISNVLRGVDPTGVAARVSASDRKDVIDILSETKPGFLKKTDRA